jgi:hypothetical protein
MADKLVINKKYLSAVNLLEFWLIFLFVLLVIVCKHTTSLVFPLALCTSKTILFATILVCSIVIIIFTPDGYKCNILLPLIRLGLQINCPINIQNFNKEEFKNCILICNYPANFIEYLLVPAIFQQHSLKTAIVTGYNAAYWAKFFMDTDSIIALDKKAKNFANLNNKIVEACKQNKMPIVYPERDFWSRPNIDTIQEFRSGIFEIAKNNNLKIFVVAMQHIKHSFGVIKNKSVEIQIEECKSYDAESTRERIIQLQENNEKMAEILQTK